MFKLFKIALIGALGLVAVLVIGGLMMSGDYEVETSIEIDAAPEHIYSDVAKLENWLEWSAWNKAADPDCKHEFAGSGVGAKWNWDGPKLMQGNMTLTKADPQTGIGYQLQFMDYPAMTGGIAFDHQDGKTTLSWSNSGNMPGIMGGWLAMVAPSMMKPEYDKGLVALKQRAEKRAAAGGKPVEATATKK